MMPARSMPRHDRFMAALFRKYDRIALPLFGKAAALGKAEVKS